MSAGSNIATEHAAHARVAAAWQRSYARGADDALGWPAACRGALPAGASWRAAADALAAWMRWHDAAAGALFTDAEWPCYAALERARVETLAARDLPGVARNLAPDAALQPGQDGLSGLYLLARAMLSGGAMPGALVLAPPPARRSLWSRLVASARRTPAAPAPDVDAVRRALEAAALDIGDGVAYAHALRALIAALAPCFATDAAAGDAAQSSRAAGAAEEHADAAASIAHQAGTEAPQHDALFERSYADYKIYSRAADQEARAAHWLQAGDAARLAQLDAVDRRQARRLAHRLQRKLQASRLQQWCFDQEQGRLDSRRLAKLLIPGAAGRVFRVEQPAPLAEACVTLLVDHSASMSAERRLMAALAIDLAVHTLELCRIDCEVLGYTTRYGATNPLAARWQREAAGAAPGRLNAVRHIVHKTPQERWCRARRALGLLLNPAFGHENIDGEALYWAARRLLRRPQPRKILLVLSDGSPYDAATAAANGRSFLERHLRAVIADIEAGPIRLAALGAGQEVSRFYAHAVTLRQPQAVAEQLFETLGDLLTGDRGATGRYSLRRK